MVEKSKTQFLAIKPEGTDGCDPSAGSSGSASRNTAGRADNDGRQDNPAASRRAEFILMLVPGIMQGDDNWTDTAAGLVKTWHPLAIVEQHEYHAGPFPMFNQFFTNRKLGAGLARKLVVLREVYGYKIPLIIWAHSNGACVALDALNRIPNICVSSLTMMAGACHADVGRNGLRPAWKQNAVKKAVAWHNKNDIVIGWYARLSGLLTFGYGYGRCGEIGFQGVKRGEPFHNFWDPLPRHSDNFEPRHIRQTVALMLQQSLAGGAV